MAKIIVTHLFCYDDHRGFSEDVRKRFADTARYRVLSFQTREEFVSHIGKEKDHKFCKIAILGVHDSKDQLELIDQLTVKIKTIDPHIGIILLGMPDKIGEIKKYVKFNIDAYIPKNANSILRIHNNVKKLISENNILFFRRKRNVSLYVLFAFLLISAFLILYSYFRFPLYF